MYYYFADALGSTRVVTNSTGSTCFEADYYPYGQENDYDTSCSPTYKFTGYEYDSETQNYYAYARYYDPRIGRFLSADPLGGAVGNPQSLNRYSYVVSNPTSLIDPVGMGNCPGSTATGSWNDPCPPPPPPATGIDCVEGEEVFGAISTVVGGVRSTSYLYQYVWVCGGYGPVGTAKSGGPGGPNRPPCELVTPAGQYQTARGVDARLNARTAQMLTNALKNLNAQGIVPVITSGYRSPGKQAALRTAKSPFVVTPAKVSWHEAGAAVDFGPNSNGPNFPEIVSAMIQAGFVWGGSFRTPDYPHFQSESAGTSPSPGTVQACADAANGG